jgi:hypothetical protein
MSLPRLAGLPRFPTLTDAACDVGYILQITRRVSTSYRQTRAAALFLT